ncbi:hypothetical protein [Roseivivax sp. CAU 1753]
MSNIFDISQTKSAPPDRTFMRAAAFVISGSKPTSARRQVHDARTVFTGRIPASLTSSQRMLPLRLFWAGPPKGLMNFFQRAWSAFTFRV